jgi:hypothetical protein
MHRGAIIVHVLHPLEVGHGQDVRLVVVGESPIPNGLTTVAGYKISDQGKTGN